MTIELFGMPGSGKTSVAMRLAKEDEWITVYIEKKRELIGYNLFFILRHPYKSIRLFFFVVQNSTTFSMFWYKFTNLFLHTNANYMKAPCYTKAVLDQGYMQNLISLFEHQINEEELHSYLRVTFPPDKLFVFDVPFEEMMNRIKGRHYIVREDLGEEVFENRLKIMRSNFDLFLKHLDTLVPTSVVFDSQNTPDQLYSAVSHAIIEKP